MLIVYIILNYMYQSLVAQYIQVRVLQRQLERYKSEETVFNMTISVKVNFSKISKSNIQ